VAVLQKNGRTYKKWTYIARKQDVHLTKKQHISRNFTVQVQWTEYKLQTTEKQTKHRKTTEYRNTIKHENKEKVTAGNWTRAVKPVAQRYRLSYPDTMSPDHFKDKCLSEIKMLLQLLPETVSKKIVFCDCVSNCREDCPSRGADTRSNGWGFSHLRNKVLRSYVHKMSVTPRYFKTAEAILQLRTLFRYHPFEFSHLYVGVPSCPFF
jgi:hypothetical protein